MRENYELNIISNHPEFNNKILKKYNLDGIETVGAYGDEPFAIQFKNNTWQKVQVKLSLDGVCVLSGELANTAVDKNMWVVEPLGTLTLKAFPESTNGGSQFVFTHAKNSVAAHVTGDLSSRGIIAAAVFVEKPIQSHIKPYVWYTNTTSTFDWYSPGIMKDSTTCSGTTTTSGSAGNITLQNVKKCCVNNDSNCSSTIDCSNINEDTSNFVSVGAGSYVNHKIAYVEGLKEPTLTETIRVRYLWFDDLKDKLSKVNYEMSHASGFPGDKEKRFVNLDNVPKVDTSAANVAFVNDRQVTEYQRTV